ncbi:conserved hypothetical protein [Burkholderia pseudomallei MSHR346]|nr:conserved hypothetical protein [Burkholderia pseudomallei MSHR346]
MRHRISPRRRRRNPRRPNRALPPAFFATLRTPGAAPRTDDAGAPGASHRGGARKQASSDQCLASPRIDRSPASIAVARTPSAPHANDALLPNASKTLAALAPLGPQAARPVTAAGRHR